MKMIVCFMFCLTVFGCTKANVVQLPPRYPDYEVLIVKHPQVSEKVYDGMEPDVKKEFTRVTDSMCNTYLEGVSEYFNQKHIFKRIVLNGGVAEGAKVLVLESTFTKIKPGNQGVRFLMTYIVGVPGFGKPKIDISYKLIDATTGKLLDEEDETRDSSFRMGKFEGDISIMYTKELAVDAGDFVERYMQSNLNET